MVENLDGGSKQVVMVSIERIASLSVPQVEFHPNRCERTISLGDGMDHARLRQWMSFVDIQGRYGTRNASGVSTRVANIGTIDHRDPLLAFKKLLVYYCS